MTLLAMVGVSSYCQQDDPTVFLVISRTADPATDPGFSKIINGHMRIELEKAKIAVKGDSKSAEAEATEIFGNTEEETDAQMIRLGGSAEADFAIACIYKSVEQGIELKFSLYDVQSNTLVSTAAQQSIQVLLLDISISKVIDDFLVLIEDRLVYSDELRSVAGETTEEAVAGANIQPPFTVEVPFSQPATGKRFEIGIGLATFILIGKASDYARMGIVTSVDGSYRFFTSSGQIIAGVSSRMCAFRAESATTSSQVLLFPLAAQIRFRRMFTVTAFEFHAAGGPAVFLINPDQTGYLFKLVPYAAAGVGLEVPAVENLGILLDLSFAIYYDGPSSVMGYLPSITFYLRP
jgi:hypothetical protein